MPPVADAPPAAEHAAGPRWLILPNVAYDADDKLGFGARAELVYPEEGLEPYRSKWVLQGYTSLNGYHHHRFQFDRVGLGGHDDLRLTGRFAFRAWLNDGYWGIGNGTKLDSAYEGSFEDEDPRKHRYRYSLVQPFGQLTLRKEIGRGFAGFVALNGRWSDVSTYEGSLLAEERPFGMDGGLVGQVSGGLLWDTRSPEVTPDRGTYVEASARFVTGAYTFAGPFLCARGWIPVGQRVVIGERVMGEWLVGDVPFYEMVHWGGAIPITGFGGSETLRGVPFGRWRAPGKALSNTEIRIDVLRHEVLREDLRWQVVPFSDVGIVFGGGEEALPTDIPFHPAAGLGIRAIYAETMVGRLDFGMAADEDEEGPVTEWGAYVVFDHLF